MKRKKQRYVRLSFEQGPFYYILMAFCCFFLGVCFFYKTPERIEKVNLEGHSMYPTFQTGERAVISKVIFEKDRLYHDQFVVVHQVVGAKDRMLKRIIGLPGDHLVVENGTVIRNGEKLEEPYLNEPYWIIKEPFDQVLGPTEIYVMGDNRNHSTDSRTWGPIDLDAQYVGVFIKKLPSEE